MHLKKVLFVLFLTSYLLQFSNSNAQQNSRIGFDLRTGYSNFTPYELNNSFVMQYFDLKMLPLLAAAYIFICQTDLQFFQG